MYNQWIKKEFKGGRGAKLTKKFLHPQFLMPTFISCLFLQKQLEEGRYPLPPFPTPLGRIQAIRGEKKL